jgi:hypothetical protein
MGATEIVNHFSFFSIAQAYINLFQLSIAISQFQKYLENNTREALKCVDGRNYSK